MVLLLACGPQECGELRLKSSEFWRKKATTWLGASGSLRCAGLLPFWRCFLPVPCKGEETQGSPGIGGRCCPVSPRPPFWCGRILTPRASVQHQLSIISNFILKKMTLLKKCFITKLLLKNAQHVNSNWNDKHKDDSLGRRLCLAISK